MKFDFTYFIKYVKMTEQEIKQQIFDLEDKIYNKYIEMKSDYDRYITNSYFNTHNVESFIDNIITQKNKKKDFEEFEKKHKNEILNLTFRNYFNNNLCKHLMSFYDEKVKYVKIEFYDYKFLKSNQHFIDNFILDRDCKLLLESTTNKEIFENNLNFYDKLTPYYNFVISFNEKTKSSYDVFIVKKIK